MLYANPDRIRAEVKDILARFGHGNGHVFNLGHGITPDVPVGRKNPSPIIRDNDERYAITVAVRPEYAEAHSDPSQNSFVFIYHISIHNKGTIPAQLISRHWLITDANGQVQVRCRRWRVKA